MTRSHPGKTAQSLAAFWPHLSGNYLLSPQVRTVHTRNWFPNCCDFCKTITKSEWFWMQSVSSMFVVVSSLLLLCSGSQNLQCWERMKESDLITDWQGRHMQANNPKHVWHDGSNGPKCVSNLFFSLPVLREELIPVCLNSNPSPVAQLQQQMLWLKGGLAVVGQKLARTGRFSCFHPTSRHDCFGFRALTLLSRKGSQRVLSRNSFMDDHKKLTTRSWWSIIDK